MTNINMARKLKRQESQSLVTSIYVVLSDALSCMPGKVWNGNPVGSYCSNHYVYSMNNRTNKLINKQTLQWTTTTWRGSDLSQESIDLIML